MSNPAPAPAELRACAEDLLQALPEFARQTPAPAAGEWGDAAFNRRALELFALQFRFNPPYRQWCLARGTTPDQVRHWTQIPAVPTAAFAEFDFSCLAPEARTAVFHSSGTTRQRPSRHFHNADSLRLYEEVLWRGFRRALLPEDPFPDALDLLILLPPAASAPHSSLVHMCETIRRRMNRPESAFQGSVDASGGWWVDPAAVWARLEQCASLGRPALILATAWLLVRVLDHPGSHQRRLSLPPGSRLMETGGYKGRTREVPPEELRKQIEAHWGLPESAIFSEYGMCELSSQAYDHFHVPNAVRAADPGRAQSTVRVPVRRRFRFPPWVRWEVVDPETGAACAEGAVGLLRIWDLANVFSVLAVQTEDLAVRVQDGFELRGRAAGAAPRGCSLMALEPADPSPVANVPRS
ncbi:MAG: hypothetical protein WHT82_03325 [Limisphaera sp.]